MRETGLRTVPLDPNRLDLIRRAVLAEAGARRAAKPGVALDPLAFAWLEPARVRQVGARHGCSAQGPYCGVPSYFPIAKYLPYALFELFSRTRVFYWRSITCTRTFKIKILFRFIVMEYASMYKTVRVLNREQLFYPYLHAFFHIGSNYSTRWTTRCGRRCPRSRR